MRGGPSGSVILLISCALALPAPLGRAAEAKPAKKARKVKLAVFDIRAQGVNKDVAATLTDVLAVELGKVPDLEVTTSAQVQSLLGLEQKRTMLGCSDVSCMAEIAGSLGVEKLCIGSLGKIDRYTVLTLRVIDVGTAQVDRSAYQKETEASKLIDDMPGLVQQLFPQAQPPGLGQRALAAGQKAIADLKLLAAPKPASPSASPAAAPAAPATPTTPTAAGTTQAPALPKAPKAPPATGAPSGTPAKSSPPTPVPTFAASASPPATRSSGGFLATLKKPWVWGVFGGALLAVGGVWAEAAGKNATPSGASTALVIAGALSGTFSFGLCVFPFHSGSRGGGAVSVISSPAPMGASGAAQ